MDISDPLINPSVNQFEKGEKYEHKTEVVHKDQLPLPVYSNSSFLLALYKNLKHFLKKRNEQMEVSQLWKSPALPFALVTTITVFLFPVVTSILLFSKIPAKIPLIYNNFSFQWEQSDKTMLFIFPTIILTVELFIIQGFVKTFFQDRRLSLGALWIITYINLLLLVAYVQIFRLIT